MEDKKNEILRVASSRLACAKQCFEEIWVCVMHVDRIASIYVRATWILRLPQTLNSQSSPEQGTRRETFVYPLIPVTCPPFFLGIKYNVSVAH